MELLKEMEIAHKDGWEFSCEHSTMDGLDPLKWRLWIYRFTNDEHDYRHHEAVTDEFLRGVSELYAEWKGEK